MHIYIHLHYFVTLDIVDWLYCRARCLNETDFDDGNATARSGNFHNGIDLRGNFVYSKHCYVTIMLGEKALKLIILPLHTWALFCDPRFS